MARAQVSMAGRSLIDAGLELGADVGGGGELALGQPVYAVVFNDVDHGQIAAHQVNELAHADGSGVAIAGDAQHGHVCGWRGWRPVETDGMRPCTLLKLMRAAHEVGRALGRAADAAHLHHALGLNAHFKHGVDDALGDGVVAAAGAERRFAAAIFKDRKADAVDLGARRCGVAVAMFTGPPWLQILP